MTVRDVPEAEAALLIARVNAPVAVSSAGAPAKVTLLSLIVGTPACGVSMSLPSTSDTLIVPTIGAMSCADATSSSSTAFGCVTLPSTGASFCPLTVMTICAVSSFAAPAPFDTL